MPDWVLQAKCRNHPNPDLWFPKQDQPRNEAVTICRTCPVSDDCLTLAITEGIGYGIWGGLTTQARNTTARLRPRSAQ